MKLFDLPNVGDLIKFSDRWSVAAKSDLDQDDKNPVGLITAIISYNNLVEKDTLGEVYGTLAYPITIDIHISDLSRVFVVQWATTNTYFKQSYSWINEEWFYNESFIIISRA